MINFILKHFFDKTKVKKEAICEISLNTNVRHQEMSRNIAVKKESTLKSYFKDIVSLRKKGQVDFH